MKIIIEVDGKEFEGELIEEKNPKTVKEIEKQLPIENRANTWGDEIYFSIPVDVGEENSQVFVKKGDLAYWSQGNGFCIFYGKTPGSPSEDKIKPASPVNVIGRIENYEELKGTEAGIEVRVYQKESPSEK